MSLEENQALVDRLIQEMGAAWEKGQSPRAEDFLDRFQKLGADPQAATRLIYEEICLRQEQGQEVTAAEIAQRFPQWQEQLRVLLDFHSLLRKQTRPPIFPEPGQTLGEFHLVSELGHGALGRVFLATQPSLADRPVVLKITAADGQEHLSLARLQHTHIVPLYWVQHFPERNLRLLCMPFLGVTTLARLLDALGNLSPGQRTGRDIFQVLEQSRLAVPVAQPPWHPFGKGRLIPSGWEELPRTCPRNSGPQWRRFAEANRYRSRWTTNPIFSPWVCFCTSALEGAWKVASGGACPM